MQAFVTGGSGFVGRQLLEALAARGVATRALARSEGAAQEVARFGAEPVRGDLEDGKALRRGMTGCDVVFHAAAHTAEWAPDAEFHRFNVVGTQNVLAAARDAGVRRLVHVSTEAVLLGGPPLVRVDESRPLPAKSPPGYPGTKAEAERQVLAANRDGLETIVVRPRLIWGRGDTSLLPKLVGAVREGRFAWIGGARHLTSTTHVRNAVEGLLLAAERGTPGATYFVTDGEPVEFRGFLTELLGTQGVDPGSRSVPRWAASAAAAVCEPIWRAVGAKNPPPATRTAVMLFGSEVTVDDARARRELGYRPVVTREAGLEEMRG